MVWIMLFSIYAAPPDAQDYDGPWKLGQTRAFDTQFKTEAECRNMAIQFIGKMQEGMLAPMRYKCVRIEGSLPKGAPR